MKSIIAAFIIFGLSMIGVVKAFSLEASGSEPSQLFCDSEICVNGQGYVVGTYASLSATHANAITMVEGKL